MDTWLKKVDEMKKLRSSVPVDEPNASTSTPATTTTTPQSTAPTTNKFLTKVQINQTSTNQPSTQSNTTSTPTTTASPKPTTTSTPSISSPAAKTNPFLNRSISTSTIPTKTTTSSPSTSTPSTTSHHAKSATLTGTTPTAPSEAGAGIWKIKYEQELKRRIELEQRVKELEKKMSGSSPAVTSPMTSPPVDPTRKNPAQSKEDRMTKRMTRKVRQTTRMSMQVANTVDSVLKQVSGLDKRIRAAEAARMQAEDKLLEIAIAKLEVDEVVQKVDTVLKKMIEQIDKFSTPQIKEMLIKIRTQTAPEQENANPGSRASMRFSIIVPKGGLQFDDIEAPLPPPAPGAPPPPVFGAPPPPSFAAPSSPIQSGGKSSLLDQIRSGIPLRNVNVDKLRQEQQQLRANAKNAINNIKSLEETLRDALTSRMGDMNLYEEDEDDSEEDW